MVKSEENVLEIGNNYIQTDINKDGNHTNSNSNDDNDDIIMWDGNNIYIKYASGDNKYEYGESTNPNPNFYVREFDSPQEITDNNTDGYVDIGADGFFNLSKVTIKLTDKSREVKNFKMQ